MNAQENDYYDYLRRTYGNQAAENYRALVSKKLGTSNRLLHSPKRKK
jgi:hypothetical protein